MMLATSKHVFKIKTCRNLPKSHDLLFAVSTFWFCNTEFPGIPVKAKKKEIQWHPAITLAPLKRITFEKARQNYSKT